MSSAIYTEHCKSCGRPIYFKKRVIMKFGDGTFVEYDACPWCGQRVD